MYILIIIIIIIMNFIAININNTKNIRKYHEYHIAAPPKSKACAGGVIEFLSPKELHKFK